MAMKACSDWLLKLLLSFVIRLAKLFTSIYKTPTGSTAEFRATSPVSPATETKDPPPKPNVSIAVARSSWGANETSPLEGKVSHFISS